MSAQATLDARAFAPFLAELHRRNDGSAPEPFPWQQRLVERLLEGDGTWPSALGLPTGAGKTACIDIAVFVLAAQADRAPGERTAPRRICFAVDRRVVVDAAYERAKVIAARLDQARGGILHDVAERLRRIGEDRSDAPLACCLLRGGVYRDDRWARSPVQPTVICSTVDQLGSRLLFRGYGLRTGSMAPIHAGLVGNDSLIVLDEAHCAQPFRQTLEAVAAYRQWCESSAVPAPPFHYTLVSATPPASSHDVLEADDADRADAVLGPRISASKSARLERVPKPKGSDAAATVMAEAAARAATELAGEHGRVAVVVNRVATANAAHRRLEHELGDRADVYLMTGRMREVDRRNLVDAQLTHFWSDASAAAPDRPQILVATQCIEVGADFDFDAMVTECASLDALRQRFGRLNRLGRPVEAPVHVLARSDQIDGKHADDPVYGGALARTWAWLEEHTCDHGCVDVGTAALEAKVPTDAEALAELNAPAPEAPRLLPAHIDALCQTAPRPAQEPDIELFLHGYERGVADVQVCWRADLPRDLLRGQASAAWLDLLSRCPPAAAECMPVPIHLVRRWLRGAAVAGEVTDVEGSVAREADTPERADHGRFGVVRWLGPSASEIVADPQRIAPGDTLVIPAVAGGWEDFGYIPDAPAIAGTGAHEGPLGDRRMAELDRGDRVQLDVRDRAVMRLTPRLVHYAADAAACKELTGEALDESLIDDPEGVRMRLADWADAIDRVEETEPARRYAQVARALAADPGMHIEAHPLGGLVLTGGSRLGWSEASYGTDIASEDDAASATVEVGLAAHCSAVRDCVADYSAKLAIEGAPAHALAVAAGFHDLGKLDPRFQAVLHGGNRWCALAAAEPLAKSASMPATQGERERVLAASGLPAGYRHELLSVHLLTTTEGVLDGVDDSDLCLHAVACHHGHARPLAPPVIDNQPATISTSWAGIDWHATTVHGLEDVGAGVPDRFWRVIRRYGWWRTAWLEAVLRLADHRVSASEARNRGISRTQTRHPEGATS